MWVAEQCGYRDLITFDMGGTSTDVALVQDLTPRIGRETKVGDLTVRASSVDVRTVGAGGGSIAHVPELTRALRVGPQSAGADPGPAAYGKGGTEPTVTDANVVLGYLPSSLAGGEITLDVDASRAAVGKVAEAMGLDSPEAAAAGIVDIVNENMLGGLRLVSRAAGLRPARLRARRLRRRRPAARQRARQAHRRLAGHRAAVPGRALRARRRDHQPPRRVGAHRAAPVRRPQRRRPGRRSCASSPTTPASGWPTRALPRDGADGRPTRSTSATTGRASRSRSSSTRPGSTIRTAAFGRLGETFDAEHNRLFSFLLDVDHELVNARATVTGPRPDVAPVHLEQGDGDPKAALLAPSTRSTSAGSTVTADDLRPGEAAGRRRGRRARDRHRDGLHDPRPARARGRSARVRLPAHQPRRRAERMAQIIETATGTVEKVDVDPVTLDLIENGLRNARYEMDEVLFRTALSPGIREQHDEFPLIGDPEGKMVVGQFGLSIPDFLDGLRRHRSRRATSC